MQSRREIIAALCGAATVAGCTEMADSESSPAGDDTPTQDDGSGEEQECATTVTIESGGMAPALTQGETVCIEQLDSYQPAESPDDTGIITTEVGADIGYTMFDGTGDVIRYYPDGDQDGTPVIARAVSWDGSAYVTKGDANSEPYPWSAPPDGILGIVTGTVDDSG